MYFDPSIDVGEFNEKIYVTINICIAFLFCFSRRIFKICVVFNK